MIIDEENIQRNIERIIKAEKVGSYNLINEILSKKRINWYEQNKSKLNLMGSDPRKAYQMILLEYMGLNPNEVPVVFENKKRITWNSYNWCPVLEACKRLNLDTRKICKAGWENSVQEMVELINPKLEFSRNYNILRPHGDYCEETIELLN